MPAAGSRRGAAPQPPPQPSLPPQYTEIRAILDETVSPGHIVNVIGLVKDCRLPVPTNGTDYKSTLTLYDLSVEDESRRIQFSMFLPEADMPQVTVGDVVLISKVKVQRYQGSPLSLITNRNTAIRVYSASRIPRPPQSAQVALAPASKRHRYAPTAPENAYVSYLYHEIDKYSLPDEHEFQQRAVESLNVKKNKFSLLKDVQDGKFYDLIAQVAREPYPGFDMATLYVSDYTENPKFHRQEWPGLSGSASGGGDSFGYASSSIGADKKEWLGPYGKMTLQITCFEPHATVVRDELRAGHWVALRNVQIKYGRDGQYLEGFMREERNLMGERANVRVLEVGDPKTIDPNLKEAIRRFRDYSKKKKKQIKEVKAAEAVGLKRKASSASGQDKHSLNSKERRTLKRAAKEQKENGNRTNELLLLGLNEQVTCETHNAPYSTIESILEPAVFEKTVNEQTTTLVMPFTCAKYQARVRLVDFFPPSLEDFACSQKQSETDALFVDESDSDSPSSSSSSSSSGDEDTPGTRRVWEWRFALQLEDPTPLAANTNRNSTNKRARIWVFVDNAEAQCLTGLDATDLRQDEQTLTQLRERMSTLWGNLEEHKSQVAQRKRQNKQTGENGKERRPRPGGKPRLQLEKPPMESSDVEDEVEGGVEPVSNKPFTCCIREYGVYEKEKEGGSRWVRCWGLFGTKISR